MKSPIARTVWPDGYPTEALDRILSDESLEDSATVLRIRCRRGHLVARVLRVNGERVYVARVRHAVLPALSDRADGRRDVSPPAASLTQRTEELVDFLDVHDNEWAKYESGLPNPSDLDAQCKCSTRRISRALILRALDAETPKIAVD